MTPTIQQSVYGAVGFSYALLVDRISSIVLSTHRDFMPAIVTRAPVMVLLWIERVVLRHDKLSDLLGEHEVSILPETLVWCLGFGVLMSLCIGGRAAGGVQLGLKLCIIVAAHCIACLVALLINRLIWAH
jgi:hypothetical protein